VGYRLAASWLLFAPLRAVGLLEVLFQTFHVPWHLGAGLTPDDKRHEDLADPVPGEIEFDRDT
jgi:hypothetical protein